MMTSLSNVESRAYQSEAESAITNSWLSKDYRPGVLSVATGGGKTTIISNVIKSMLSNYPGLRFLLMAHKSDLVTQISDRIELICGVKPSVMCSDLGRKEVGQITVGSKGTIINNLEALGSVNVLIIDECHKVHHEEGQYIKLINHFLSVRETCRVLGVTATPFRSCGSIIGQDRFFKELLYEVSFEELVKLGFLIPIFTTPVNENSLIDTSGVAISGEDFNRKQLAAATEKELLVDNAIADWREKSLIADRKATMFFSSSVKHGEMISASLSQHGLSIPFLRGGGNKHYRKYKKDVIKMLNQGFLDGVVNYGLFVEGTDVPRIDCVALLTATQSLSKYMQIIGRGARPFTRKEGEYCLFLDYGQNVTRFGPIEDIGPPPRKREDKRAMPCPKCNVYISIWAFSCCHCNHQIKEPPGKTCKSCGERNFPSSRECVGCGQPFFSHEDTASTESVMKRGKTRHDVRYGGVIKKKSSKGPMYLVMMLVDNHNEAKYYHNIFLWHEGLSSTIARGQMKKWMPELKLFPGVDDMKVALDRYMIDRSIQYIDLNGSKISSMKVI